MKIRLLTALLLFLFFQMNVFASQKTAPGPLPERPLKLPKISEKKLSNGLLVIVAPLPTVPKVSAFVSFHAGRALMRDQKAGVPTIAGTVLKEGTATRTSKQIQEELRSMGASLNTNVSDDATQITGNTLSEFTESYLMLLSDMLQHPAFPQEEVDLAKQNTIQTIQGQRAQAGFLANERTRLEVFGRHPYSFTAPDEISVGKIDRKDLMEFASAYYVPNNAHIILVGDITAEKGFAMAEKAFGGWKSKAVPAEKVTEPVKRDKRQIYFVNRPGSVQSTLVVALATFPRNSPEYFRVRTADSIFGSSFSSRLTQNIREKRGYSYSPFSVNLTWAKSGLFTAQADVRNEVTGPSLLEMFYELDRMRVSPVTDEELKSAKAYQNGSFSGELASQGALAARIDSVYTYNLARDFIQTFREKVNAITAEDVQKSAARYFDTYRAAIIVVGDYEKVKDQVAPFGDVVLYDDKGNKI